MKGLPNLNAMRVFEAAARLGSFTHAASELGVTQSAVSKQVAGLEAQMGQPLFVRGHRQITLTPYGAQVAGAIRDSLQALRDRMNALESGHPTQLRLVCDADFALLWLFPRLPSFEALHPEVRVAVTSEVGLNRPPEHGYDCAVIWGRGNWTQCRFQPLLRNVVFPVAAPGYFARDGRRAELSALRSAELIHDQSTFWWSALFAASGIEGFDPNAGRLYNQTVLCLEAAARGDGITVGDEVSSAGMIREGRLERVLRDSLPSPDAYYIATPLGAANPNVALEFSEWLQQEAATHRTWCAAHLA